MTDTITTAETIIKEIFWNEYIESDYFRKVELINEMLFIHDGIFLKCSHSVLIAYFDDLIEVMERKRLNDGSRK